MLIKNPNSAMAPISKLIIRYTKPQKTSAVGMKTTHG